MTRLAYNERHLSLGCRASDVDSARRSAARDYLDLGGDPANYEDQEAIAHVMPTYARWRETAMSKARRAANANRQDWWEDQSKERT
jgi:hypothetical protein